MGHKTSKQALMKLFMLVTLCFIAFGFTARTGLDGYEIYLNDKLILKQFVNQPLSLRKLRLDKADQSDQLRIHYRHCTPKGVGTGRSIAIKDQQGKTLKKWEFADSGDSDVGMVIPVKALVQLEKHHSGQDLRLYYAAHEHPEGEMLASVQLE